MSALTQNHEGGTTKKFPTIVQDGHHCGIIFSMGDLQDPKMEVPIPYIRPIFQAYVREYHHKIWP
jgi:hypothetical protein